MLFSLCALAACILGQQFLGVASTNLNYGDEIYLQSMDSDYRMMKDPAQSFDNANWIKTDPVFNWTNTETAEIRPSDGQTHYGHHPQLDNFFKEKVDDNDENTMIDDPSAYKWLVMPRKGFEAGPDNCVKYGDTVRIQNARYPDKLQFLAGGVDHTALPTKPDPEIFPAPFELSQFYTAVQHEQYEGVTLWETEFWLRPKDRKFEWIVRSGIAGGEGFRTDVDPAHGTCVMDLGMVYLQVNSQDYLFLTAEPDDFACTGCFASLSTLPGYDGDGNEAFLHLPDVQDPIFCQYIVERQCKFIGETRMTIRTSRMRRDQPASTSDDDPAVTTGEWKHTQAWGVRLVGNTAAKDTAKSTRGDINKCAVISAQSRWVMMGYSSAETVNIRYYKGREASDSRTRDTSWARSVSATVEVSASFMNMGASVSVTGETQSGAQEQISQAITMSTSEEREYTFTGTPGAIWQFQLSVDDACNAGEGTTIGVDFIVNTPGANMRPCCLPGLALDKSVQYGPCQPGSPCSCSDEVCNGGSSGSSGNVFSQLFENISEDPLVSWGVVGGAAVLLSGGIFCVCMRKKRRALRSNNKGVVELTENSV